MPKVSFLHSGCPIDCVSPNFLIEEGWEHFPRRLGTGFFAKRANKLYYLTARHCLTKSHHKDISEVANRLHIPYFLEGNTNSASDFVTFNEALSLRHNSEDIPGELIDLVVLSVVEPSNDRKRKHLLSRAVKLPPTGGWLEEFIAQPIAQNPIAEGKGIVLSGIGYPYDGTATDIYYPQNARESLKIVTQRAKITGHLSMGEMPDRLMLKEVSWDNDLNGFSGSPVFIGYQNSDGKQYALAGMLASGGNGQVQFVKISVITKAFGA